MRKTLEVQFLLNAFFDRDSQLFEQKEERMSLFNLHYDCATYIIFHLTVFSTVTTCVYIKEEKPDWLNQINDSCINRILGPPDNIALYKKH